MLGLHIGEKKHEEDEEKEDVRTTSVVKVIEVIGTSPISFGDATAKAVHTASRSLRHVSGGDVKHMTISVKDGKIAEYRVTLKLAFALEDDD